MPRQYFFWKYLNTIIVLYCIIVQKNPIFVQLSPIQCTYSNIFIRFFKFSPANTNIYQNSYMVIGVLCGLRQGVLSSQCGHLISFGTKYSVIASLSRHPYSLACNALYVILRSCIATTWESPGREPYYKTHARYFCTCVEKKAQCAPYGKVSAFCFPLSRQLLLFFTQLSIWHSCQIYDRLWYFFWNHINH